MHSTVLEAFATAAAAAYDGVMQYPVTTLLLLLAAAIILPWAVDRWKYRNIPGPFSLPLIGDVPWIILYGLHEYCWRCQQKYGKIFKVYMGGQMLVVVGDPEISKKVTFKMINRSMGRQMRLGDRDDVINTMGLAAANGELWRSLRLAWQPTFNSDSLEGYSGLMDECAQQLAEHLRQAGQSGEVVEVWRALGKMTLAVVGTTAYGVDFHTMPEQHMTADEKAAGTALQDACQTMFSALGLKHGSIWQIINLMVPSPRLVGWLAVRLPDRRLLDLLKAREVIRNTSASLIAGWRAAHPTSINAVATAAAAVPPSPLHSTQEDVAPQGADSLTKEQPLVESISAIGEASSANKMANGTANGAASGVLFNRVVTGGHDGPADAAVKVRREGGKARVVHPGSFMGLMLAAKNKASGHGLSDEVIMAQSNTFILAGYETTANTLSFCIYNIAANPEVQQRLLQEVDAYGRDRRVAYRDMDQFPYAEAVVRESLRLYPPATMLNRQTKEGGYFLTPDIYLPEKVGVFPFVYGYQRDPEYWPAASEFRPERWLPEGRHLATTTPEAWTPFGSGARMCIGWRFALQEAKIALIRLYQHQTYELLPGQVPLPLQLNLTLSPKYGVKVRVIPR